MTLKMVTYVLSLECHYFKCHFLNWCDVIEHLYYKYTLYFFILSADVAVAKLSVEIYCASC